MLEQPLTSRQAISVIVLFNFGSSVVIGVSTSVGQDNWLSMLLATLLMIPAVLMYARILKLNPGQGLFDAIEARLGKVAGKIVTMLMAWYALHLCALVMRNFSEFIQISSLLDTPQLPVLVILVITVCFLARYGCKALGKWSVVMVQVVLGIVLLTVLLSLNVMRFDNILPVFEHPFGKIAQDAFSIFAFPFCEAVLFMSFADCLRKGDEPRNIYLSGMLLSGLVLLVIILRNLFVLGASLVSIAYFPSYVAARIISLGDFLSRIEGSISVNFILAGIVKITVCLIAASKGISKLFGTGDYRQLALPTALLAMALAFVLYKNTMEMFAFIEYYPLYASLFQVLLPAILWIASEIGAKRTKTA